MDNISLTCLPIQSGEPITYCSSAPSRPLIDIMHCVVLSCSTIPTYVYHYQFLVQHMAYVGIRTKRNRNLVWSNQCSHTPLSSEPKENLGPALEMNIITLSKLKNFHSFRSLTEAVQLQLRALIVETLVIAG